MISTTLRMMLTQTVIYIGGKLGRIVCTKVGRDWSGINDSLLTNM